MHIMSFLFLGVGVSVFIFGMILIRYSLDKTFSDKIKSFLVSFTSNRFSGVFTGTIVTFCLQSSSASSVLTAAFADSGLITLYQAFWIIVGANLGTAFTGIFTAAELSDILPSVIIIGVVFLVLPRKLRLSDTGILLCGFGLLYVGMDIMGSSSGELSNVNIVRNVLVNSSSPVTGITAGAFFTALIQSSSAVTALLQLLSADGIVGIRQAFYIILGSNIGTCATCALSSIGLHGSAKKVSLMHIFYNLAGAVLFASAAQFIPIPELISELFPENVKMQIAAINIVFNLISAVSALCLPVGCLSEIKKKAVCVRPEPIM